MKPGSKTLLTSRSELNKINDSLVRLLVPITIENVYKNIIKEAMGLGHYLYGSIFLYDEKKKVFVRAYTNVKKDQQFTPRRNGNTYWVYVHNKPRLVPRERLAKHHPEVDTIVHSVLLIPLSHQNKKLGVLSLKSSKETPFTDKDKESLVLFGTVASLAIYHAQLYQQKQQALETRDLFMSTASHEFKTPLTSIRAYAQLAEKHFESGKPIPPTTMKSIIRNVDRLNDMINSLFLASQISAGTFSLQKERFDLYVALQQCVEDMKISTQRAIVFSSNVHTHQLYGDKNRICSVVINLIKNSLTYSPADSVVEVIFECTKKTATLIVKDSGNGIEKKYLRHIFDKYFRPNNTHAGLGLGLYLCYQIVKAHQGTISIESEVGKGTTVTVIFPS